MNDALLNTLVKHYGLLINQECTVESRAEIERLIDAVYRSSDSSGLTLRWVRPQPTPAVLYRLPV